MWFMWTLRGGEAPFSKAYKRLFCRILLLCNLAGVACITAPPTGLRPNLPTLAGQEQSVSAGFVFGGVTGPFWDSICDGTDSQDPDCDARTEENRYLVSPVVSLPVSGRFTIDGLANFSKRFSKVPWFEIGSSLYGGSNGPAGAGLTMRFHALQNRKFRLAVDVDGGLLYASLALPLSLRIWDRLWLYFNPTLRGSRMTWGLGLPLGLSIQLSPQWWLNIAGGIHALPWIPDSKDLSLYSYGALGVTFQY